jgi:hypothetical protein
MLPHEDVVYNMRMTHSGLYAQSAFSEKYIYFFFASLEVRTVLSSLLGPVDPEDEGTYFLRNFDNSVPFYTALHPRTREWWTRFNYQLNAQIIYSVTIYVTL